MQQDPIPSQFRPRRALVGGVFLLWLPIWFRLLDQGAFDALPKWVGVLALLSLFISIFAGVILVGNGLGLLTSETLASSGDGRAPTLGMFVAVYLGSLAIGVGGALLATTLLGINWMRSGLIVFGALFLIAASRRPWWFFATIRRVGWFASLKSDQSIRWILGAIGTGALFAGLFLPIVAAD